MKKRCRLGSLSPLSTYWLHSLEVILSHVGKKMPEPYWIYGGVRALVGARWLLIY